MRKIQDDRALSKSHSFTQEQSLRIFIELKKKDPTRKNSQCQSSKKILRHVNKQGCTSHDEEGMQSIEVSQKKHQQLTVIITIFHISRGWRKD